MATELYIDGKLCDLEKKEVIAMSYGVNRLTDIESRQGFYSNTFKLPLTANNLGIFGIPTELNSSDTTRWERLECSIESDGIIQIGFAQLQSVQDTLSVVVKSGNASWIEDLTGKLLSDLDMSEYDHIPTVTNVSNNRFNDYTDGYIYPDIDYGQLSTKTGTISHLLLRPSLFLKPIIDKIFPVIGWTLTNDIDTDSLYREMILPFSNNKIVHSDEWLESRSFRVHSPSQVVAGFFSKWFIGIDNNSTGGFFDNNNQITLGAWTQLPPPNPVVKFLASEPYIQEFTAVVTFDVPISNSGGVSFDFFDEGVSDDYVRYVADHSDLSSGITYTKTIRAKTLGNTSFPQSVVIEVSGDMEINIQEVVFSNEPSNIFLDGSLWEFSKNMPSEFKQTDLIKYILNAFCLIAIPDSFLNTIRFSKFDDIPNNTGEDWSDKLDLSEREEITPNYGKYKKNNVLMYENDLGDKFIGDITEIGSHTIVNSNNPEGKKIIYKAPLSLCGRGLTMSESITKAGIDLYQIDSNESAGYKSKSTTQRIGIHRVVENSNSLIQLTGASTVTSASEVYWEPIGWDELALRNWATLTSIILKPQMVKRLMILSSVDINQLDFTRPKWIEMYQCYFYLSFINQYKVNQVDSTEVELIKLP